MKKILTITVALMVALTAMPAFADIFYNNGLSFHYDPATFEIAIADQMGDMNRVIMHGTNKDWADTWVSLQMDPLDDGEDVPTIDEIKKALSDNSMSTVTQDEWNGYHDTTIITQDENTSFVVPIKNKEDKVTRILTIVISAGKNENEEITIARDDAISEILDTMHIDPESEIYSPEEISAAAAVVMETFKGWSGDNDLRAMRYAGDESASQENLDWLNESDENTAYDACLEFLTDFHTATETSVALDPDTQYTDYEWWLARTKDGEWEIADVGY